MSGRVLATASAVRALFRAMEQPDESFVFHSWLRSFGKGLRLSVRGKADYYKRHHELIERLLPRSKVLVACDPQAHGEVWSYCCFEARPGACVVHWVYTKQAYRRFGLAGCLVGLALQVVPRPLEHSHRTDAWAPLGRRYRSTYNPNALEDTIGSTAV